MTIKTSGPISVNPDIINEFGGSAPHELTEFYNAGPGVPTSGRIQMSDFYGVRRHPYTRQSIMSFASGRFTYTDRWLGSGMGFISSHDVALQTFYPASGYSVGVGGVIGGYSTTPMGQKILGLYWEGGVGADGAGGSVWDSYFRHGNGGVAAMPLSGAIRFRYKGTGNNIERLELVPVFAGGLPVTLYPSSASVGSFNQQGGNGVETLMQWNLSYNPFSAGTYYVNMRYY